ncbi:MAG: hypothetical protein HC840_16890 [Leptolyngbyaceae cyanobacterium RM2_2_4]|nr:hypothetical protein [Leptolyngbyaceae cyanobacterium RM2_2_4]
MVERDRDIELITKHVPLKWSLELELREYGVKSFYITVPEQEIELEFEENIYDENDNIVDVRYFTEKFTVKQDANTDFNIPEESGRMFSHLYPHEIEIYKSSITVRFAS